RARRSAVDRPPDNALKNGRKPKHAERNIEFPVGWIDVGATRATAILTNIFTLTGYSQGTQILPRHSAKLVAGQSPGHQVIREIGERMAERGQLPIEHGYHPRLR